MSKLKPPLPAVQRGAIDKARKRHLARAVNPGVAVEPAKSGYRLGAPHRDREAWEVQILDAFGTRSVSVAMVFLDQLAALCRPASGVDGQWAPNEIDLNAMVAMVTGMKPRNELEAALAAQMVAIHILTARILAEAAAVDGWVNPEKAALAAKMARTFAQQCDALNRLKGRVGKQSIKVKYERHNHQHVHVEGGPPKSSPKAAHTVERKPRSCREIATPLWTSPRCLARTRAGTPCQAPAVKGRPRCRMHGSGRNSGAPKGQRNGSWRDGSHTNEAVEARREVARINREWRELKARL